MTMPPNKYLMTRNGRFLGSRVAVGLLTFGPMALSPFVILAGVLVGDALDVMAIAVVAILVGAIMVVGPLIFAWASLIGGAKSVEHATMAWRMGDLATAIERAQAPLRTVFRADVRTRALYVLGLAAESNADFAEAADLFARASAAMPAMIASKYQKYARCLMLSHQSLAFVALRRFDEADAAVRMASAMYPQMHVGGAFDAFTDDAAFGAMGISKAVRDIELGRDPRGLLTLASALVLAARGMPREAMELVNRERYTLNSGLSPRERALVDNIEARAHAQLSGGPMRAAGMVAQGNNDPWAERVLPTRA